MPKKVFKYTFPEPLIKGKLIKRYKRFLADVELSNGDIVVAHCTNSGSMKSCIEPGADVYLSTSNNPNRKTKYTWELINIDSGWVGINTLLPNQLVYEALEQNYIPEIKGYINFFREVTFEDSRFDIYAENYTEKCFIEIKNVTYKVGKYALFPDSVSSRGTKHLYSLIRAKKQGFRAIIFYLIQRTDIEIFSVARPIDPVYATALERAIDNGVEVIAYQTITNPPYIQIHKRVPFELFKSG